MAEKLPLTHPERLKWFRNVNLLGAGALIAAGAYVPGLQPVLYLGAGINVAEAGAAEAWRQRKLQKSAAPQTA